MTQQLGVAELLDLMHTARSNWEALLAEAGEARLTYRQGEWAAAYNLYAPLDAQERHAVANRSEVAQANALGALDQSDRRSSPANSAAVDLEQARLGWRARK
jgi:serine/threonine protein kinase HipA of HipAB toxin-antitoxin module